MAEELRAHWDRVYEETPVDGVGWYEAVPELSLELIERCGGLLWGTSANISGSDPQTTAEEMQAALDAMDPQPMLCVLVAEELPGNVSDVVRFGPDGPEVIR